jgi:hypothetical protein
MSESTSVPRRLILDVDLDPDITQDEMSHDGGAHESEHSRQLIDDVPPHHGA